MLNISHLYNSLLSKDIENNINAKIENIKNTIEWSDLNVKSACEKIDSSNLGINDLKYHAAMLENISKLSVDLILDYDYYKNFIFKRHFMSVDYDEKFKMLGYEIQDEIWHNVKKPSKDTVIMNVFLSCLYNSLTETMPIVKECPYCDNRIEPGDEKCIICDEPVANMPISEYFYKRNLSNNININEDIKRTKFDSVQLPNEINTGGEIDKLDTNNSSKLEPLETQRGKDETAPKDMQTFHDILTKNQNKWICKPCGCLNPFNLVNCEACETHCKVNGYWICCKCNLVNAMSTDICAVCDAKNELIVPANQWKCWKPQCNALNDEKIRFCNKCSLQRIQPDSFSDLIERFVEGKTVKLWICGKCWQYNNDNSKICANYRCGEPRFKQTSKITDKTNIKTCDSDMDRNEEQTDLRNPETTLDISNNTLDEKDGRKKENHSNTDRSSWICEKCTFQNVNERDECSICGSLNVVETEWKCWNKNCERMNKIVDYFCQTCKLDKNPPDPETKLVKCYDRNEMRQIWICGKCEKYNAKDKVKCEGKNCGSYKYHISSDYKDDKNKSAMHVNQNEIQTNSCQWECNKCTFINNDNSICCTACNSKRNDSSDNDKSQTSSSWKCWFVNCKQSNDDQYKFCQYCKLERYGSSGDALVKCQDKNGSKDIWICRKCFKYNSLSDEVCGGKTCKNFKFEN